MDVKSGFLVLKKDTSAHIQREKDQPREGGTLKCTCCISLLTPVKHTGQNSDPLNETGNFAFYFS